MPQDQNFYRQQVRESLDSWALQPNDLKLQTYIQKLILPNMQKAAPAVKQLGLQVLANGERKFIVFAESVKFFDTSLQVVDWLDAEQKARETAEAKKKSA